MIVLFEEVVRLVRKDGKTLEQLALKTGEEAGELAEAVLCYGQVPGTTYKAGHLKERGHLVEECADVMLAAAATAMRATDGDLDLLIYWLEKKLAKWERVIEEVLP